MSEIEELLKEIYAIADNDEPDDGYGFPKIMNLSNQALALLAEPCECDFPYTIQSGDHKGKFCPFCGKPIKELKG